MVVQLMHTIISEKITGSVLKNVLMFWAIYFSFNSVSPRKKLSFPAFEHSYNPFSQLYHSNENINYTYANFTFLSAISASMNRPNQTIADFARKYAKTAINSLIVIQSMYTDITKRELPFQ